LEGAASKSDMKELATVVYTARPLPSIKPLCKGGNPAQYNWKLGRTSLRLGQAERDIVDIAGHGAAPHQKRLKRSGSTATKRVKNYVTLTG
jgi:hypothetical protein